METVEFIVFMSIALVLGSLVIGFVTDWDYSTTGGMFGKLFNNHDIPEFEEVDADGFVGRVVTAWTDCGYGMLDSTYAVYVRDDNVMNIDKTFLFNGLKGYNICKSLQSNTNGCGIREDITMKAKKLPALVVLKCHSINSTMSIT